MKKVRSSPSNEGIRLNKAISDTGTCSRREADTYIEHGRVFVNGVKAKVGDRVTNSDEIRVDGRIIKEREKDIYIVLNKPVGIVCTTERQVKDNIIDYLLFPKRIFPIGRLDKESEGLILLTNNGDIVNKILRAGNDHEKEYIVTVNKPITADFIEKMGSGVPILGETTKKCEVEKVSEFIFRIVLVQGLNRQIRRMCEHFGYEVTKLKRVRIMNVTIGKLPVGDWRELSDSELEFILNAVKNSTSEVKPTAEKSSPKPKSTKKPKEESPVKPAASKSSSQRSKSSASNSKRTPSHSGKTGKSGSTSSRANNSSRSSHSKNSRKR
jgi:23S rRNA pseudouridine2604 synthase